MAIGGMTTGELAQELGVTPARITQLVNEGRLEGCYTGDRYKRRFDLMKCVSALNRNMDPGSMLAHGLKTRQAMRRITAEANGDQQQLPLGTDPGDPAARYEMARTEKAEEDLRAARLKNGQHEGRYVLAVDVARQVSVVISQEVKEVETFLREVARTLADRMGVDFKTARQILVDGWRDHRKDRSSALSDAADAAVFTDDEEAADI